MSPREIERLKVGLKALLPPLALDLAREAKRRLRHEPVEWQFLGYSWPEFDAASQPRGWDEASVAARYAGVLPDYRRLAASNCPLSLVSEQAPRDLGDGPYDSFDVVFHNSNLTVAYALARAAAGKSCLRVLDWGGAIGQHSLLAKGLFPELDLDYACLETPTTAAAGRRIAPGVRFIEALPGPDDRYDLVMASCSLHYVEDWRGLLGRLFTATRGYVFLHQVPIVHRVSSFTFVQRPYRYGYDTEYVGWCLNRQSLVDFLAQSRAGLAREFIHGFKPPVAGAPEQPEYRGYLMDVGGCSASSQAGV
jgi:putative methyltransferase (TIGR04325 family)